MAIVLRGATVVTMNARREVLEGDVRIEGARIAAVGEGAAARAGDVAIDVRGMIVLPGLVQTHVHLAQALFRGMADDLPLLPWLEERIWPLEAAHDPASLRASADLGLAEMLLAGTTTVLDMGTVHHHDAVFEALAASGMRAKSGKALMDQGDRVPAGLRETAPVALRETERLIAAWQGAADGRLGYAIAPRFVLSCSEALLRDAAALAQARGVVLHTHVAEHAAERAAVREALGTSDVEALRRAGVAGPTTVMAHGVQLTEAEMRQMAAEGTRIAHCPSANLKLASGIADVPRMRASGLVVGLGADGAPCNNRMDPWTELRQAALLAKAKTGDAAALRAHEALALATLDGARCLGLDGEIGSLEAGKRADVCVVRGDALHQVPGGDVYAKLVYATVAADVRHVLVDGAWVVRDGALVTLDEAEVRRRAEREGRAVLGRAGLA